MGKAPANRASNGGGREVAPLRLFQPDQMSQEPAQFRPHLLANTRVHTGMAKHYCFLDPI
jgi:hypothetical protein